MRTFWSKEEIEILINLYEKEGLSVSELYPIFFELYKRTLDSVKVKIGKLGLRHTKEQISKLKSRLNSGDLNGMYNKTSPMKGLTKENSELVKIKSEKISKVRLKMFKNGDLIRLSGNTNPMFGSIPWSKGKTKFDDIRLYNSGLKTSKIQKELWLKKSELEKNVVIRRLNDAMIQTKKPTKIELKIESLLNELNINFNKNFRLNNFLVDFYLPNYNLVIECDGDYWHSNPLIYNGKELDKIQLKNIDRDRRKEEMLRSNEIDFIRFWEYDIKNNFTEVKNKLLTILKIQI